MTGLRCLLQKKNGLTCNAESSTSQLIFTSVIVLLGILFCNMFNFVTWNVHGLTQEVKHTLLANDAARYGMDLRSGSVLITWCDVMKVCKSICSLPARNEMH